MPDCALACGLSARPGPAPGALPGRPWTWLSSARVTSPLSPACSARAPLSAPPAGELRGRGAWCSSAAAPPGSGSVASHSTCQVSSWTVPTPSVLRRSNNRLLYTCIRCSETSCVEASFLLHPPSSRFSTRRPSRGTTHPCAPKCPIGPLSPGSVPYLPSHSALPGSRLGGVPEEVG